MSVPPTEDHKSARELRKLLLRGKGSAWLDFGSVRSRFGGGTLSPERRRDIDKALAEAGIDASPAFQRADHREQVFLEVTRPPSKEHHPLVHRVLWRWTRTKTLLVLPAITLLSVAGSLASLNALGTLGGTSGRVATPPALGPMSGDLNIAVAPFASGRRVHRDGFTLADQVARSLRRAMRQLDPSLDIQTRGPGQLGGVPAPGEASAIAALARRVGADVVIYGELGTSVRATSLTPRFYLNAEKLPAATELAGSFGYGAPIRLAYSIDVSPQQRAHMRGILLSRTVLLTSFFVGVGYYLTHDLGRAKTAFDHALQLARGDPSTAALARLFLGNIAGQRRVFRDAVREYRTASRSVAVRTRARWGLAEVSYQRARGSCDRTTANRAGLERARRAFVAVRQTTARETDPAAEHALRAKLSFGLGQVDLCLSHAGLTDHWDAARREFGAVIRAYAGQHPGLRDDAAEAHGAVGLVDVDTTSDPRAGARAATVEYRAAAQTTTSDRRRAYFLWMLGQTERRSGDAVAAEKAWRAGLALHVSERWQRRFRTVLKRGGSER